MRFVHVFLVFSLVVAAALTGIAPAGAVPTVTVERVSVVTSGTQSDDWNGDSDISADGRYVAFVSNATNLVTGDTNLEWDVFVHDRGTGATERVSVHSNGTQGDGRSGGPAVSADGRYVAFWSNATNLVANDTNVSPDTFVHDRQTGTTVRVSVHSNGSQGLSHATVPDISADGRVVAFLSASSNLVDDDTNAQTDIFVHDLQTGATERVSVHTNGTESDGLSHRAALNADGSIVSFGSLATTLADGDTNGLQDVFVHDRQTGVTERVSVHSNASQGDGESFAAHRGGLDAKGNLVVFESLATTLVDGDTNAVQDVFVHDRRTGVTTRVSLHSDGTQGDGSSRDSYLSDGGRQVVFESSAENLADDDTQVGTDVFVRDLLTSSTRLVSVNEAGAQGSGTGFDPAINADGRHVSYTSDSTDLVPGDTNGVNDVFVWSNNPMAGVHRLAGPNRFATAAAISQDAFPSGADTVYVANGYGFPDALAGGPAATMAGGPLLLVDGNGVPAATAAELTRLDPDEIVILGGTAVVPAGVETILGGYAPAVRRLDGPNRFATAAAISQDTFPLGAPTVYLANGYGFPDALAGGPAATLAGGPLLLVDTNDIPPATALELIRLDPAEIVILGGTAVISANVETLLGNFATTRRLSGPNRFATAAVVSQDVFPFGAGTVYVANGYGFPDALAGGPAATLAGGPLLLVDTDGIPAATAAELTRLGPVQIVILGGTSVVSANVETQLATYLS